MNSKKLYIFNICFGMINTIAVQMLPLMLVEKHFDSGQVATVVSFVFLAALLQPIVGIITQKYTGSKRMMQLLLVGQISFATTMLLTYNYQIMLLSTLLFSLCRVSLSPMYDSYVTNLSIKYDLNYGFIRSGASLGFGIGISVYTLISFIFGLHVSTSFLFLAILALIAFILLLSFPAEDASLESQKCNSAFQLGPYITLVAMYTLFFGTLNFRISYLSTYYVEFGYSTIFLSIATFAMVVPEIIFLPLYNKLFYRFNKMLLLSISFAFAVLQIVMYLNFMDYPIILIFTSMLNGMQIMLFFPTFFPLLRESLGQKYSSLGFIMNMTIQSLFVGLVNLLVIKPIFIKYDSTVPIFKFIFVVACATFIPLVIYNYKYYKKTI